MPRKPRLIRGKDYVITDDGAWEFTREYLLNIGECCKNDCRFCPYRDEDDHPCPPVEVDAPMHIESAQSS